MEFYHDFIRLIMTKKFAIWKSNNPSAATFEMTADRIYNFRDKDSSTNNGVYSGGDFTEEVVPMLYNATHKWLNFLPEASQEDILNCPEFFAMSLEEIEKSGSCPEFLLKILRAFPWLSRPNVIQVKPQDFRKSVPRALGTNTHLDDNVRLKDGVCRTSDNLFDFRLLSVCFGDVLETDFVSTPMELPDLDDKKNVDYAKWFANLPNNLQYHHAAPNQLAEYTSRDLHRMGTRPRLGRARLFIVAFECNKPISGGKIFPTILEREKNPINFDDYNL
jgi:hypothetical protein